MLLEAKAAVDLANKVMFCVCVWACMFEVTVSLSVMQKHKRIVYSGCIGL